MPICSHHTCLANLLLKDNNVFTPVTEQSTGSSRSRDLGLQGSDDTTLFSSKEKEGRLLSMDADRHINNPTISVSSLHSRSTNLEKRSCLHTALYLIV